MRRETGSQQFLNGLSGIWRWLLGLPPHVPRASDRSARVVMRPNDCFRNIAGLLKRFTICDY